MFGSLFVSAFLSSQIPHIKPVSYYNLVSVNQNPVIQFEEENYQILEKLRKNQEIDGVSFSEEFINKGQFFKDIQLFLDSLNYDQLSPEDLTLVKQLRGKFINELITLNNCPDNNCSFNTSNLNFLLNKTLDLYAKHQNNINNIPKNSPKKNLSRGVNVNKSAISNNKLKINGSISKVNPSLQPPKSEQYFSDYNYTFPRNLNIRKFSYKIVLNKQANIIFSVAGNEVRSLNLFANSPFRRQTPLARLIENGGITLNYNISDSLMFVSGYYAGELKAKKSAFDDFLQGNSSFVSQLKFTPNESISMGFLYIYSQNNSRLKLGGGTVRSQLRLNNPISAHSYGFDLSWQINPKFSMGGTIGFTDATVANMGQAQIWNYAFTFGIKNLSKKGDFLGLMIGQPPKLTSTSGFKVKGSDKDLESFWLGEIFYRYPINKNVSVTPSFMWLSNPQLKNSQENWKLNLNFRLKF